MVPTKNNHHHSPSNSFVTRKWNGKKKFSKQMNGRKSNREKFTLRRGSLSIRFHRFTRIFFFLWFNFSFPSVFSQLSFIYFSHLSLKFAVFVSLSLSLSHDSHRYHSKRRPSVIYPSIYLFICLLYLGLQWCAVYHFESHTEW